MFRRLTISAAVLLFGITGAMAQVRVGLMVSATGPTTAIGIPQKNTGELLPRKIGDASVEYIQLDDGGDTTRAVQNAKKLIGEDHIDALIGPSTTPNALAASSPSASSALARRWCSGSSGSARRSRWSGRRRWQQSLSRLLLSRIIQVRDQRLRVT